MSSYSYQSKPYFTVNQAGIIIEVSNGFCAFTGFGREEMTGKSIETAFSVLLRSESAISLTKPESESFLFTKSLCVKNVIFRKSLISNSDRTLFVMEEIPNSSFEEKNQYIMQLISENKIGVGIYTPRLTLILANQKYLDYLPVPHNTKELTYGKNLRTIIPGFKESTSEQLWLSVLDSKNSIRLQETQSLMHGNNQTFWDGTISPIIENDQVNYLVSLLEDVTERVLSREIIKEQEEHYKTLLDNMSDGLLCIDKDLDIIHMNQPVIKYREKFNLNYKTDIYYDTDGKLIPKDDLPNRKVLRGSDVRHQRLMIMKNDRKIYLECNGSSIKNSDDSFKLGILTFRDVTNTIEYENRIERQKKELDALLDRMIEGIIIADSQGNILRMNTAAIRMLSLEETECAQFYEYLEYFDLVDQDGHVLPLDRWPLARAMEKERISNLELWLHYKKVDKSPCLLSFTGAPIYNEKKEFLFSIIAFRDTTERWLIQEKLILAIREKNEILSEAMAFKDEFFYLITHEMKTPLAVINSALQTMDLICKDMPDKAVKYLRTISQNTNRQLRLVNNLMDIIRINSGKIKINNDYLNIVRLVDSIVTSIQPIAIQKNVKITFTTELSRKILFIDEEKVERILLNLLSNALKFTPKNREIHISLFSKKINRQNMVCISIRDEGIGIPKDKQSIIFERFGQVNRSHSRPAEGTGIGLYLVKLLVDAMGGSIELDSEVGVGSNFTVILPDQNQSNPSVSSKPPAKHGDPDSRLTTELAIQLSDIYF